jgi:hypothetical protein
MVTLLVAGCGTTDAAKRMAFETLQGVGQQKCQRSMNGDCPNRAAYDDYQRALRPSAAK